MRGLLQVWIVVEAVTFFLFGWLHLGTQIAVGPLELVEPRIIPALIVEGLCGTLLAVAAIAVITRQPWARSAAIGAHLFAIAGVLLGMVALALGRGPRTHSNDIYHRVIMTSLVIVLALLFTPAGKRALTPQRSLAEYPGRLRKAG